jgi:hypothetical protein
MKVERIFRNIPVGLVLDFVKIFPTLLTEVLIGTRRFIHNSYTPTVLPNLAGITLDEHATEIVGHQVR